jgi:hypothetical protein
VGQAIARALELDRNGGYSTQGNLGQQYTWGESYVLMGYLNLYQATLDPYYLHLFVKHADEVIKKRDDRAHLFHSYPAWAVRIPSLQGNVYWLAVDQGMILIPLAKFAALVKNFNLDTRIPTGIRLRYPALRGYTSMTEIANRYAAYGGETLLWIAKREYRESILPVFGQFESTKLAARARGWTPDVSFSLLYLTGSMNLYLSAQGYSPIRGYMQPREESAKFLFASNGKSHAEAGEIPYNMQNSLGIAAGYLYQFNGRPEFLKIAKGLFRNYMDALSTSRAGFETTFYVDYWGVEPTALGFGTPEDISHGWIAGALFLGALHESGVGVQSGVVGRYGRLATERLRDSYGKVYVNINRQDEGHPDTRTYPWWSEVESYTPGIRAFASTFFSTKVDQSDLGDAVNFLSITELLRNSGIRAYGATCQTDAQCASGICYGLGRNSIQGVCGNRLGDGSTCTRHFDCTSGICGSSGVCLNSGRALNGICVEHSDCSSGRCFAGSCRSPVAWSSIGGQCLSDLDCPSNGVCGNGICAVRNALGNGSACTRSEECLSEDCFDNRLCQARLGNGSTCRVGNDCSSGICFANQVCGAVLGNGSVCYQHQECSSKKCNINSYPPNGNYWRPHGVCEARSY